MSEAGDGLLDERQRDGDVPREIVDRVRRTHRERRERELDQAIDGAGTRSGVVERQLERELLQSRRSAAVQLRRERVIDDAVLRDIERELDLEEVRLAYDDV
jgi:CPA1 family monovalent cation:H+ antiporter